MDGIFFRRLTFKITEEAVDGPATRSTWIPQQHNIGRNHVRRHQRRTHEPMRFIGSARRPPFVQRRLEYRFWLIKAAAQAIVRLQ